jgi:hypothetical protein
VACLYAHHSLFPLAVSGPRPAPLGETDTEIFSAADVLRRFNQPGGTAHEMADVVADRAVEEAGTVTRSELVERFSIIAPAATEHLRTADPTLLIAWPATAGLIRQDEALRIVVMEATVHLLDVLAALGEKPLVPGAALRETVGLLTEMVEPVNFIEAATGRSSRPPLPVLR